MARQQQEKLAAVTTGGAGHPAFPARRFTTYTRSPRGPACLPPSAHDAKASSRVSASTGAPGPHDFAVRYPRVRLSRVLRPPLPASTLVTIGRNAPLHRGGMAEIIVVICPTRQARKCATNWHDGQFEHDGNAVREVPAWQIAQVIGCHRSMGGTNQVKHRYLDFRCRTQGAPSSTSWAHRPDR
jgi:hypothetical protein